MRDFNAESRPPTVTPEVIEAAMNRAHRLRSEALRDLGARLGRALGERLRALGAAVRRDLVARLAGGNVIEEPAHAPTRGRAAPGWRATLRARGWVYTARCNGS